MKLKDNSKNQSGVTLLEIIIVVAIIAILSAIAWPKYKSYVINSHRSAAISCLMNASQFMERFHTMNMRYDETEDGDDVSLSGLSCNKNLSGVYAISLSSVSSSSYKLQAMPQGHQATADSSCGTLYLDNIGNKSISGNDNPQKCW